MQREVVQIAANIASGQSVSGTVYLHGAVLLAISMPAAWTAADITFLGWNGSEWQNVYDDAGNEVTLTAPAAGRIIVNAGVLEKLAPLRWIALRSGTAGSPVAQGADRLITIIAKG